MIIDIAVQLASERDLAATRREPLRWRSSRVRAALPQGPDPPPKPAANPAKGINSPALGVGVDGGAGPPL